jgi:hypothetical protein
LMQGRQAHVVSDEASAGHHRRPQAGKPLRIDGGGAELLIAQPAQMVVPESVSLLHEGPPS